MNRRPSRRLTVPAPPPLVPSTTPSGQHPSVQFMRKKLDSIVEHEVEELKKLNERLARATLPVPKDPRREGDSEPPVDVVEETVLDLEAPPATPPRKE